MLVLVVSFFVCVYCINPIAECPVKIDNECYMCFSKNIAKELLSQGQSPPFDKSGCMLHRPLALLLQLTMFRVFFAAHRFSNHYWRSWNTKALDLCAL